MNNNDYFYKFLLPISKEVASLARELENSVFRSPRMMLTTSRTVVEDIIQRVIKEKGISDIACSSLLDRIQLLQSYDVLPKDVLDAIHTVRKLGNEAAHDTRVFRYSESIASWEALYILIKWYIEMYSPVKIEMPSYQEPATGNTNEYGMEELDLRLKQWQNSVLQKVTETIAGQAGQSVAVMEETEIDEEEPNEERAGVPGDTTIRTISYQGEKLEIPYFLRDAFLLPQRFENAERFMIALGGVQQARIMSELPNNLEGMSTLVKRYKEENEAHLFHDLRNFVSEEFERRRVMQERKGELFIFFKSDYLIMTDKLGEVPLTEEYFKGFPNFLRQLHESGFERVEQLPQELLILAKFDRVGVNTVKKLFTQMKEIQEESVVS